MLHEINSEICNKIIKEQKSNIELFLSSQRTYVILVAINKENSLNKLHKISCQKGISLGGYVYDEVEDCYIINCSGYIQLEYIPLSIIMQIKNHNNYQLNIPLSNSVIKKLLNSKQKEDVDAFSTLYKPKEHIFNYIQLIEA